MVFVKSKLKTKKFAHGPLLSVENNSCASPRNVIEVMDNWENLRATVGTSGHVMPAETKKFAAASGEHRRLG